MAGDIVCTIFHIREDDERFCLRQKSYLRYASTDGILDTPWKNEWASDMKLLTKTLMITTAFGIAGLGGNQRCEAVELTAPALVESSLKRFAHDDADMVRHVDEKAYEQLAKEENDFAKDAELLRAAIRSEPEAFRRTVEARIQQVLAASHEVAVAGQAHVDTQLRHALDALAEAVGQLNAEFPQSLRPTV